MFTHTTLPQKLALGVRENLRNFACCVGATQLLEDTDWKEIFLKCVNSNTEILFNVSGLEGASPIIKLWTSYAYYMAGASGHTDWELSQIAKSRGLKNIKFYTYNDGIAVAVKLNPNSLDLLERFYSVLNQISEV